MPIALGPLLPQQYVIEGKPGVAVIVGNAEGVPVGDGRAVSIAMAEGVGLWVFTGGFVAIGAFIDLGAGEFATGWLPFAIGTAVQPTVNINSVSNPA